MTWDDRSNIGPHKPLPEAPVIPSVPSVHELAEAVREFLAGLDDKRHIVSWVDIGEGENVMDRRAKVERLLSQV